MNWAIHLWGKDIRLLNILDLVLVIFLVIQLYRLLRGTLAFNIFWGVVVVYCAFFLVHFLKMPILSNILEKLVSVGLIAIIIIFQPEIRRFLLLLGKRTPFSREGFLMKFFAADRFRSYRQEESIINNIILAVSNMAASYTGALIVLFNNSSLKFDTSSGVAIDGFVSARLLESIFRKGSPLHDGAVIIADNRIIAARVVLPVSENPDLPPRIGLRHRSAVGVTEHTESLAIIISEEKGDVSYAQGGKLFQHSSMEELKVKLYESLIEGNP
ncbi:MAG TPA: diadenylate cyclase CdaA [Chitinophagaceae bacterium]|nr:diadenylate cyclase CdaA [Chitinophagaceae bacterium]